MSRYTKRPNIPGLSSLSPEARRVLEPVKQLLDIHEGRLGNPSVDAFVRKGEVSNLTAGTGASATTETAFPQDSNSPDAPTNVAVVAGSWGNRISWTNPTDEDL